jgi:glycosyltransferase involved in cell wall biosynthesis
MSNISVLILTLNEEINISDCLSSAVWSDDILIFDSGSTDRTVDLAKQKGARVLTRFFDDYGSQRQAALEQGDFKNPWLLVLDADERVDEKLAKELNAIASDPNCPFAGYSFRRKDYFLGQWIPRATLYPTWHPHFFLHTKTHYEKRSVHEYPVIDGPVGNLKGHLLHYTFNKGLEEWREKHRKYAKLEAKEGLAMRQQPVDWKVMASPDLARRRRSLKALSYRLPFRGTFRFLYMMLVRLAFLDGLPGIRYSLMISRYEHWIEKEMKALQGK